MQVIQQTIMEHVERRVEAAGFRIAQANRALPNVVSLRVYPHDSPKQVFQFDAVFDQDYMTGGIVLDGDAIVGGLPHRGGQKVVERSFVSAPYADTAHMNRIFAMLDTAIVSSLADPALAVRRHALLDDALNGVMQDQPEAAAEILDTAIRSFAEANPIHAPALAGFVEQASNDLDHAPSVVPPVRPVSPRP